MLSYFTKTHPEIHLAKLYPLIVAKQVKTEENIFLVSPSQHHRAEAEQ